MIRFVWVKGRRFPAPIAPAPVAYMSIARRLVSLIQSVYLEVHGLPHVDTRDDAISRLTNNRKVIVSILRATDRARDLTEHNLSLLVDNFLQFADFTGVVDSMGNAVIRDANTAFNRLVESVGNGRPLKAQIATIDHRVSKETARFLPGFRQKNLGLIKTMVTKQVEATEQVLRGTYGQTAEDIANAIQTATNISTSHAELIARDQTLKMNAQVQRFRAQSLGANQYTWITSMDERVRGRPGGKWADAQSNHWRLHGKKFSFNDPPLTNEKKGIRLNPGEDFQCRCTATPDLSHIFGE